MTTPTPSSTSDNEELRKQIFKAISPHSFGFGGAKSYAPENVDYIVQLITAQTQLAVDSAVVEGQLEILELMKQKTTGFTYHVKQTLNAEIDRLSALQQQQKDDGHE